MPATTASSFHMSAAAASSGPKTLRLTSQAAYARPARREAPSSSFTSTYDASVGAIQPADAERRCVAARAAVKYNDMVAEAVSRLPASVVTRVEDDTLAEAARRQRAMQATFLGSIGGSHSDGRDGDERRAVGADGVSADAVRALAATSSSPAVLAATTSALSSLQRQPEAFGALTSVLAAEERHGIRGAMVRDFFGAGGQDGPFAGSRSAQGESMASTFFAHSRPFGGAFATERPSRYTSSGYRFKSG